MMMPSRYPAINRLEDDISNVIRNIDDRETELMKLT